MDDIFRMMYGMVCDYGTYKDRAVKNDKVGDYTIDTAYTSDYGYETAIKKYNNAWIIVERYSNKEESKTGHKKWCEFCKTNPKSVYSVQWNEEKDFEEE